MTHSTITSDTPISERMFNRERAARHKAEQLLEDKSRELYELNINLEKSLVELQQAQSQLVQSEKMASVGQLAAGIAHEINNPVGFIASNLGSLKEYFEDIVSLLQRQTAFHETLLPDTAGLTEVVALKKEIDLEFILDDVDSLIKESIDGTQRVRKIVSDLSEFSHVNSPDLNEQNINELLDKTLNIAANELKYCAEVVKEYQPLPAVVCNGGKLGQVFLNLLINAAHAMPEKGTIYVRTMKEGDYVQIQIEDTGCGISEKNRVKIFDPFFTTKDVGKGTGLGLHIVNDVMNRHGGSIRVDSIVGEGTTFSLRLPVAGPPKDVE